MRRETASHSPGRRDAAEARATIEHAARALATKADRLDAAGDHDAAASARADALALWLRARTPGPHSQAAQDERLRDANIWQAVRDANS